MAMGALALARKMAGKKRPEVVQWQQEICTNDEWEELVLRTGLTVVDVYQEWCGPCVAMASHLKEMKLQLGEDMLHCATAKADTISRLRKFRGRSEPTWLFLASGYPVAVVQGANVPLLRQTLLAELQAEKRVLEEGVERKTLDWEAIGFSVDEDEAESSESNPTGEKEPVTLLILTSEAINEADLESKLTQLLDEKRFLLLQKLCLDSSALIPLAELAEGEDSSNSHMDPSEIEITENVEFSAEHCAEIPTELPNSEGENSDHEEVNRLPEFVTALGEKFQVWIIDCQTETPSSLQTILNDLTDQYSAKNSPDDVKLPNYFFLPNAQDTKFLSTRIQRHILQEEPTETAVLANDNDEIVTTPNPEPVLEEPEET